jgi:hypothetical protein
MEQGFTGLIYAAATMLGLILVALVFSYQSAISRIENILEFRHFAKWTFMAGFSCFLYFSFCIVVGFRLSEDRTSHLALVIITICTSLLLIISHALELKWALEMCREDWRELRGVFWAQLVLVLLSFLVFEGIMWASFLVSSTDTMERYIFTASSYILLMTSLRAVVLVASSFWCITILSQLPSREG